jgi:hypothetical protein
VLTESQVYEERRDWTAGAVRSLILACLLVALAIADYVWTRGVFALIILAFFALGTIGLVSATSRHLAVFRVDAEGITLFRTPLPGAQPRGTTTSWPDIQLILVTRRRLGVMTKSGGPTHLGHDPAFGYRRPDAAVIMGTFPLNPTHLAEVVRSHAPTVQVIDNR